MDSELVRCWVDAKKHVALFDILVIFDVKTHHAANDTWCDLNSIRVNICIVCTDVVMTVNLHAKPGNEAQQEEGPNHHHFKLFGLHGCSQHTGFTSSFWVFGALKCCISGRII